MGARLDGYPNYGTREIGGVNAVIDYGLTNPLTGIGGSEVAAIGLRNLSTRNSFE